MYNIKLQFLGLALLCLTAIGVNMESLSSCNSLDLRAIAVHMRETATAYKNLQDTVNNLTAVQENQTSLIDKQREQISELQKQLNNSKALNGAWTEWVEWGQCTTTCGVGLQSRERTCTNPEPKFGGTNCVGESSEYRICNATECTDLNGEWATWAEWGQCSSTCGVGQQHRNRTCSNPEPKFGGKHCEGEPSEYRICSATNCTDLNGEWVTWAEWGQCSSTCEVGQQHRNRTCSNPEPRFGGKHCEGEPSEYRICSATNCTDLNGKWATWAEWGQCSSTCGVGQQHRNRMCSNPEPKFGGKYCEGEPSDYRICSATNCTDAVGFTAYYAHSLSADGKRTLSFSRSTYISDDSFNMTSGIFTCKIPGLYVFTATVVGLSGSSTYSYSCHFYVNGVSTLRIFAQDDYDTSYPSASSTVVFKLRKYDTVYLGACTDVTVLSQSDTSFSGFLVVADDE